MNDQLRRLGALRAITTVIVAAAAAALGLSLSGLSVGGGQEPAVATVRPQLRAPATSALATGAHNARSQRRSRAAAPSRPQRKRCRPVDGVTFTVSVGTRCPKPLKGRPQPHISARLRKAASRPRLRAAPVKDTQTSKPAATSTTSEAQPKHPQPQPTATLPAKQPSTVAPGTGGAAAPSTTVKPSAGTSPPND
jgi:hypothetical protein